MAKIPWKGDLDDDCYALIGRYILYVTWKKDGAWWAVYFNGEKIKEAQRFEYSPSMRGGRLKAGYAMRRHEESMVSFDGKHYQPLESLSGEQIANSDHIFTKRIMTLAEIAKMYP